MIADNENLPFSANQFDSYIANFSLMIVPDHIQMLKESIRVIKSGSIAAFSVWGRKENSPYFSIIQETLYSLKDKLPLKLSQSGRSNFHLSQKDSLINDLQSVGFRNVKSIYVPVIPNQNDAREEFNFISNSPFVAKAMEDLNDEHQRIVWEEFERRFL